MTTVLESESGMQISLLHCLKRWSGDGTCARGSAGVGAGVWAAIAIAARVGVVRIGAIELMFLFAPLVIVPFVIGMPYVVAIGFVVSAALKMVAAATFSLSLAALAVLLRSYAKRARQLEARILLQVAAGAVFAGMVLSSVYAVLDFLGSDVLTIPEMARTHGILNAVGFCMMALLGWAIEFDADKS